MMRIRLVVATVLATAAVASAQQLIPGSDSIRADDLKADLFFLASDGMQGRLTDTPGNRLAAEFIRSRFQRMGLAAAGPDDSFFQRYRLMTGSLGSDNRLTITSASDSQLRLVSGQDFYPQRFTASGVARGALVFLGYGISAPDLGHDDYRDADVKGKIVLALEHEPGEGDADSPFDGLVTSEHANPLRKTLLAQSKGAAAIVFVRDVHVHAEPENFEAASRGYWPPVPPRIERYMLADWVDRVRIPAAEISSALADILLRDTGRSLMELARAAESDAAPPIPVPGIALELSTDVRRHTIDDRNVVAKLEGTDPALKDEWIIICAHYDHNGVVDDQVMNGADDDGSGIVGLLEIAEAYALAARDGQRPKRSLLFAAWNSEERGLLGAWAYTERPLAPLEQTVAVLNMDMIGRNEEVPVGGGGRFRGLEVQTAESNSNAVNLLGSTRSPELAAVVQKANAAVGLELRLRYDNNASNLLRRSDHWPFLQRGVPAVWLHTGLHPDYHTIYDDPEKINYRKLEQIARLVHRTSWLLAEQPERPKVTNPSISNP